MVTDNEDNQNILEQGRSKQVTFIILDCTNIQYIDEAGFNSLKSSINEYEAIGVRIFLTNCHGKLCLTYTIINYHLFNIYLFCEYRENVVIFSQDEFRLFTYLHDNSRCDRNY